MFGLSCTSIGMFLFAIGLSANGLCILVFLRQKFRHRIITPYFIVLLFADSIYLLFRLIKLFYYSQTLFNPDKNSKESCSNTLIARAYQHATQTWPQILVPLIHSETYMRFSLILMCMISVQRTTFITRSITRLVLPSTYNVIFKHKWTVLFIILSFILAYMFEFVGLTLFCPKSSNPEIFYQWFVYMSRYMDNTSHLLTNTITDEPQALKCVHYYLVQYQSTNESSHSDDDRNGICTKEQLTNILSFYFDQHQRLIVNLIQKILLNQTGERISRNEIRRKYHFHECLFRQEPNFFEKYYDFMYSRRFGLNRHTLVLVCGSVLPSLITILSNLSSIYRIRQLTRLTSLYITPCRRRIDDTRRVLLIITVECLFAILNSWFSDIIISVLYCKGTLLADGDCPGYLRANHNLLVMFDMFNSISNLMLYSLCGRNFRRELIGIFQSIGCSIKKFRRYFYCCYIQFDCQQTHQEPTICYYASFTKNNASTSSNNSISRRILFKFQPSVNHLENQYFHRAWHSNSKLPIRPLKKQSLRKNPMTFSSTHHDKLDDPYKSCSMRLYFPQQQTEILLNSNKKILSTTL